LVRIKMTLVFHCMLQNDPARGDRRVFWIVWESIARNLPEDAARFAPRALFSRL
jgi:hypothetical protein